MPQFLSKVLSLLSASPNLEDFILIGLEDGLADEGCKTPVVFLKRSHRLVLEDMSRDSATSILSHIATNVETTVRISDVNAFGEGFSSELSRLPVMGSITSVCVRRSAWDMSLVALGPSAGVWHAPSLDIFAHDRWFETMPVALFSARACIRDFWMIEDVDPMILFGQGLLIELLKTLPALETSVVHARNLASVLDVLASPVEDPALIMCPKLSTLEILLDGSCSASANPTAVDVK
ncbi:hypothetical protein AcV5_008061 [Taiwanofungus camphoratus]|nr:hypothetical protein AcV5_008061 [Antrodia cinnamomea]